MLSKEEALKKIEAIPLEHYDDWIVETYKKLEIN